MAGALLSTMNQASDSPLELSKEPVDTTRASTQETTLTTIYPTNPPPSLPYFRQRAYAQNLSHYTDIAPEDLTIPQLRSLSVQVSKQELDKAFANFKMDSDLLSYIKKMDENNKIMLNALEKYIEGCLKDSKPSSVSVRFQSSHHPEFKKEALRRVRENLDTVMWEEAWSSSPELRKYSDQRIHWMVDCLFDSLHGFGPKSVNARLNLAHLSFPGGLIAKDLNNFKLDILPCFFDRSGNMRLEADIEEATIITAEFIRSISKDRHYFSQYLKSVKSHKTLPTLYGLMQEELSESEDFYYTSYIFKHGSGWDSLKDTFGYGTIGVAEAAKKSVLNEHMRRLMDPATKFVEARELIQRHKGDGRLLLKKMFNEIHLKTYTKYGVLKNYVEDTHYKKLTAEELKEIRKNQDEIDMLNTALWIRSKVNSAIRNQFGMGTAVTSSATLKIVDKLVDHVTTGCPDPLEDLMASNDASEKEVLLSFFDEEGILRSISREQRLSIIANQAPVPTGSHIPNKFVNLFYTLGSQIGDTNIRHQILRYLVKHPDADAVLQHNYQKIGKSAFLICIRLVEGLRDLQKLKNLDFIRKFSDNKQISNHHSLTFLAAEFFEAFYKCGERKYQELPKKYLILSCIDSLSTLMYANNRIENASRVDQMIKEMFDDFQLPRELYHSQQNATYSSWLLNCLNDLDSNQLEKLITKYDKI